MGSYLDNLWNKSDSPSPRTMGHDQLNEVHDVASGALVKLIAFVVVLFGLLAGSIPLVLAIVYEWTWVAPINFVLMSAGAVLAFRGWQIKSNRLVWTGGALLIASLVVVQVIKGL